MTVREQRPEHHARVLVRVGAWSDDWHPATAHVTPEGVRWRFDTAGWMDAHPNDEWTAASLAAARVRATLKGTE